MASTIRYIGNYDVAAEGKILWEILCQLRGLGVGRYVRKTEWDLKWPGQPSYLKIVKARPEMDRWLHRGTLWAEWTFRGRHLGVYRFTHDLNRPDWKLVHRHDEAALLKTPEGGQMGEINLPDSFPLPPLQVLTAKRYAEKAGQPWDERNERAPLDVCLDPQFHVYRPFIRQSPPARRSTSIYDECDPETFLQWYGDVLPPKISWWAVGPAEFQPRFQPGDKRKTTTPQSTSTAIPPPEAPASASPARQFPGKDVKLLLVTGSVISGVGKGVITSSLGLLLRANGYRISTIKIDPYLNIDAGTFSPFEHGEVFVLDDGGEVDLDFGNYERFLNLRFKRDNNVTGGKMYMSVLTKEREGKYLGKTVQLIPHVTSEIVNWVERVAAEPVDGTDERPEVCILELGGTVGDIESDMFLKAFGDHFMKPVHRHRLMNVHVSMLVGTEAEPQKTKPMQRGVDEVRRFGLVPDLLMARCKQRLSKEVREKIAEFAHLEKDQIIDVHDVASTLRVPLLLEKQGILKCIQEKFQLDAPRSPSHDFCNLDEWKKLVHYTENPEQHVNIALVGKYVSNRDAYKSVTEALSHAGIYCNHRVHVRSIESDDLVLGNNENEADQKQKQEKYNHAWKTLKDCDGVLVPGGFGDRGIEGMIVACEYARTHSIPFFGICLGMQTAVIEYARNVGGIEAANSTEFASNLPDGQQVVIDMPEHAIRTQGVGASMRLGRRSTVFLTEDSVLRQLYAKMLKTGAVVEERHRHRYEVNPLLVPELMAKGLRFVGMGVDERNLAGPTRHVPATESSAQLAQMAATDGVNQSEDALLDKVAKLCARGGDGVTAAAVRMEIVELKKHPYFVGVQYHPEFLSSPFHPSPPFLGLILASIKQLPQYLNGQFTSKIAEIRELAPAAQHSAATSSEKTRLTAHPLGAQPKFNY
ncbi:CTP synthase [Aphelenchoides fujianensis]|nr:CTP synthase [Aphelenchoides fujianensis]